MSALAVIRDIITTLSDDVNRSNHQPMLESAPGAIDLPSPPARAAAGARNCPIMLRETYDHLSERLVRESRRFHELVRFSLWERPWPR